MKHYCHPLDPCDLATCRESRPGSWARAEFCAFCPAVSSGLQWPRAACGLTAPAGTFVLAAAPPRADLHISQQSWVNPTQTGTFLTRRRGLQKIWAGNRKMAPVARQPLPLQIVFLLVGNRKCYASPCSHVPEITVRYRFSILSVGKI